MVRASTSLNNGTEADLSEIARSWELDILMAFSLVLEVSRYPTSPSHP